MKHPKVGGVWQIVDIDTGVNKLILVEEIVEDYYGKLPPSRVASQYLHVHAYLLDGFEPEHIKGKGEYSNIQWSNSYKNYTSAYNGSCYKFIKRIKEAE